MKLVKEFVNRTTYKRMVDLVRSYWQKFVLGMLCMMGVGWTTAGTAYLIQPVLDDIFLNKKKGMLLILPLIVLALVVIKGLCMWGSAYLSSDVSNRMIADLRQQLYEHMQTLSLDLFNKNPTGDLMSRIITDVIALQSTATSSVVGLLREGFAIIGLLAVIFYRDWRLACIAILILPAGFYPLVKLSRMLRTDRGKRSGIPCRHYDCAS